MMHNKWMTKQLTSITYTYTFHSHTTVVDIWYR